MSGVKKIIAKTALLVAVCILASGCPPDITVKLMVSPTLLDFGAETTESTVAVSKNVTGRAMGPLVVRTTEPWIRIDDCTAKDDGCVSGGPTDIISVPIRVDRSRMVLGYNLGAVVFESEGAPSVKVDVLAEALLVPDFEASNRTPEPGRSVIFTDMTQTCLPADTEPILRLEWDFGDGSKSSQANPSHVYATEGAYTVSLRVETARRSETVVKEAFIIVGGRKPVADFRASATSAFTGDAIEFTDLSSLGLAPITAWLWDFGDGKSSSDSSPIHTYTSAGVHTVSLTVTNAFGSDTETKASYIVVRDVVPPRANFTVSNAYSGQRALFQDTSAPGTMPITSWRWNFGDPNSSTQTSTQQNPAHVYNVPGTYQVSLTVTSAHGRNTVTKSVVIQNYPLTADFSANKVRGLTTDTIQFSDNSDHGNIPITGWLWNFGDGTTSTLANPVHQYSTPGTYDVSLRVTTAVSTSTAKKTDYISVFAERALDRYIRKPDAAYSFVLAATLPSTGVTGYVIKMTSQAWRTEEEVNKPEWVHWLTIIRPSVVTHSTALLFISGGSNRNMATPPSSMPSYLAQFARDTKSVAVYLQQVPSEPLVFTDEPDSRYETSGRTEDEIIAYSYDKYFQSFDEGTMTADEEWPLLLAMAKSAVKAMDTTQTFLGAQKAPVNVKDFVVTGASKRGWTTWLTGAADGRVRAIAPIVIDTLNMDESIDHHRSVYGFYSDAIIDYVDMHIFERFNTVAGQALLQIVDPYEYRDRLTMPKLLINSTGDEFFLPDSAQFYFHDLRGENYLTYLPNTNHSLGGYENVAPVLGAWYQSLLDETGTRPRFSWTLENDTRMSVYTQDTPDEALLWTAVSAKRDFRLNPELNPDLAIWSSKTLSPTGANRYTAQIVPSQTAWTAFFIQLKYATRYVVAETAAPFILSTEIHVAAPAQTVAPKADFSVTDQTPVAGESVQFTDLTAYGTATVNSWLWNFGDGTTSTLRDPVHAYALPGTYDVSLTSTSFHGTNTKVKTGYMVVAAETP